MGRWRDLRVLQLPKTSLLSSLAYSRGHLPFNTSRGLPPSSVPPCPLLVNQLGVCRVKLLQWAVSGRRRCGGTKGRRKSWLLWMGEHSKGGSRSCPKRGISDTDRAHRKSLSPGRGTALPGVLLVRVLLSKCRQQESD